MPRGIPRPVNDRLHDALTMRSVDLVRLANGEAVSFTTGIMRQADELIAGRLAMVEGSLTPAQFKRLDDRLRNILAVQERRMRKRLNAYVGNLSADDLDMLGEALERVFRPLGLKPKIPAAGSASARARSATVRGVPMSRMFQRFFRNDRERVLAQVRAGIADGLSGSGLARSVVGTKSRRFLDGIRQVSRRSIDTVVQTISTHTVTQARELLYEVNPDLVREERWVSTLDNRTSDICQALDGRVFPVGQGIMPPAHPNCRSARMPIVPGLKALPVDPAKQTILPSTVADSFDGKGPQVLTYNKWLSSQPVAAQRDILGPTRFALFQTGEIELRGFVNDRGVTRTLDELRRNNAKIFTMAGLDD